MCVCVIVNESMNQHRYDMLGGDMVMENINLGKRSGESRGWGTGSFCKGYSGKVFHKVPFK